MTADDMDRMIDEWHEMDDDGRPLREYLGVSYEEYKEYIEKGTLPKKFADKVE